MTNKLMNTVIFLVALVAVIAGGAFWLYTGNERGAVLAVGAVCGAAFLTIVFGDD